ncbi:MAG TPA: hypothetical protein VLQ79_12885 [Myxococcaceae bacterium]|nr:hypothetical protein [Myxococcaceae bacterium]
MANVLRPLLDAEDERGLLRFLAQTPYEVYPRRVPPDWTPFIARPEMHDRLPPELYLAAADLGPVLVDRVKRGPDKGALRVDEVRSPVVFWERSQLDEDGALRAGQLWAELEVTPQTGRRDAAPDRFRRRFSELDSWLKKTCRRSEPVGWLIGPSAARRAREGLVLRAAGHRGEVLRPFR